MRSAYIYALGDIQTATPQKLPDPLREKRIEKKGMVA
jgi:hypothetical protein